MAKANKPSAKRPVRCYLCGHRFEVSARTMSTSCSRCNKAIIIEDLVVKSYVPVNDLQTCGKIRIMKRGRVAAKRIQSGDGIVCEGFMEGDVVTDGDVELGPKATWKGKLLQSRALAVADGAKLMGVISVPWERPEPKRPRGNGARTTRSPSTTRAKRNGSTTTTKRSSATTTKRSASAPSAKAARSAATVKRSGTVTGAKRGGTATATKRSRTSGSTKRTASATRTKTATAATSSKRTAKKTTKRPATTKKKKKTTAKRVVKKATTKRAATKKKTTKKTAKKPVKKKTKKKTTRRR